MLLECYNKISELENMGENLAAESDVVKGWIIDAQLVTMA